MIVETQTARAVAEALGHPAVTTFATQAQQTALINFLMQQTVHTLLAQTLTTLGIACPSFSQDVVFEIPVRDPLVPERNNVYVLLPLDSVSTTRPRFLTADAFDALQLRQRVLTPAQSRAPVVVAGYEQTQDLAIQYEVIPTARVPAFIASVSNNQLATSVSDAVLTYGVFQSLLTSVLGTVDIPTLRSEYYLFTGENVCDFCHDLVFKVPAEGSLSLVSGGRYFIEQQPWESAPTIAAGTMYHLPFDAGAATLASTLSQAEFTAHYVDRTLIVGQ